MKIWITAVFLSVASLAADAQERSAMTEFRSQPIVGGEGEI
jgi:hypothetical protein